MDRARGLRLTLAALLVMAVALALPACGGGSSDSAATATGEVRGEVASQSARTPIPGATVKVGSHTVLTDTDGHFVFPQADLGSQTISVGAAGYAAYESVLNVESGQNVVNVVLEDASIIVRLKENAEVTKPLKKIKVKIGDVALTQTETRRFEASSIPVGQQTLTVTCPGHEPVEKTVTVVPGRNTFNARLNLTPEETYWRYYAAYRFARYRQAWDMVHPDVRRRSSYRTYAAGLKAETVLGLKLFGTKMLSKWRPSYMDKTYRHVAAIDRAYRYSYYGRTYTDNRTQHWAPVDGRWYIIFNPNP